VAAPLPLPRPPARGPTAAPVDGPPKTASGDRWVDVGTDLTAVLDRLKAERPALALLHRWRPVPRWCFVTRQGRPFDQASVRHDFNRIRDLAGLQDRGLTPHCMRHSFAAWHINRGANVKWLSQQLGHSSIAITLTLYAKWFRLYDSAAADALGTALLRADGNTDGNTASR